MRKPPFYRILLLDMLRTHGEITGYQFSKLCKQQGIILSPGSIYPLLHELLDEGLVKVRIDGKRKIYSLTTIGSERIECSAASQAPEFLKQLFFRNLSQLVHIRWDDKDDIMKLIANAEEAKRYLEEYLQQFSPS